MHYFYLDEFLIQNDSSPIVYRYIDWSITALFQEVQFYPILSTVQSNLGIGMLCPLLVVTAFMLVTGYCGEKGSINAWFGFEIGTTG